MIKVMKISCYQKDLNTKFGVQDKLEGLAYQNRYANSHGHETVQLWLPSGKVQLDDSVIEKDFYAEFGLNGRIESCLIK